MKTIATGLCVLLLLSACAVYKDKQGQTHYEVLPQPSEVTVVHTPPPPPPPPPAYYYAPAPPPPPPAYYYAPAPPPAVIYEQRGGGYNPEHQRSKRVQSNCNNVWSVCANNCNTIANATQRAVCIANCNHSRDLCIKNGLGY
ncbi:MAG: hypothetical protein ACLGQW_10205 [Acidobacteriota bacterium]